MKTNGPHLLVALFISLCGIAQPLPLDDNRPCSEYQDKEYDLNQDGEIDIMLYVGSEGTDDEPSSFGHCFYRIGFIHGGMMGTKGNRNPQQEVNAVLNRKDLDYLTIHDYDLNWLLFRAYGRDASPEWYSHYETNELYYPIYLSSGGDTAIGWIQISIDKEAGNVEIVKSQLSRSADSFQVGQPILEAPKPFAKLEGETGVVAGMHFSGDGIRDIILGGRVGGFYRYGIRSGYWRIGYLHTELGYEFIPSNVDLWLRGPYWANRLHFIIFDVGFSMGYGTNDTEIRGDYRWTYRYEVGLSMSNFQFLMYGPLGSSSNDLLSGGSFSGFIVSYTLPLWTHE
ncbi:MAG: hypothetical protein HWE14_08245 [Flavobacteriia bacterium]|nr:hypothetical protein [Flavobacteriia bacterium]